MAQNPSPRRSLPVALATMLVLLVLVFVPISTYAQSNSHLAEFSEPGEQAKLDSTWQYLTSDGTLRTVDVYQYGTVMVAFDETGQTPLSQQLARDFFQSYELRVLVTEGYLSESAYSIPFQQSLVCYVAAPQLGSQALNEGADQASSIIEKTLPDGAAAVAADLFNIGDKIGLIGEANPYVLALGAACEGGDLIENYAATQLKSCQDYVANLREFSAYAGMAKDLVNCHSAAIQKLQLAQVSPNVLAQYGQTFIANAGIAIGNVISGIYCDFAGCHSTPQTLDQSVLEKVMGQISSLEGVDSLLEGTTQSGSQDASADVARVQQKGGEANQAIANLSSLISTVDSALNAHSGWQSLTDSLMSPPYNFSAATNERVTAASQLSLALSYLSQYRYNSAIAAATQGSTQAEAAFSAAQSEERIPRSLASWVYVVLAIIGVLAVLAVAWAVSRD